MTDNEMFWKVILAYLVGYFLAFFIEWCVWKFLDWKRRKEQ